MVGMIFNTFLIRSKKNGGKILVPKTAHADESGFFALFLDTEGNKLGLIPQTKRRKDD
jgi:predicted enzyme related to lactoylglutathione lyase